MAARSATVPAPIAPVPHARPEYVPSFQLQTSRKFRFKHLAAACLATVAVFVLADLVLGKDKSHPTATINDVAAAAPVTHPAAPAPHVAPAPPPTPAVEAEVTSTPAGATVTLIDNGKSSQLGVTPLKATFDPTHVYDVEIAHAGYATKVEHIASGAPAKIDVDLGPKLKRHAGRSKK